MLASPTTQGYRVEKYGFVKHPAPEGRQNAAQGDRKGALGTGRPAKGAPEWATDARPSRARGLGGVKTQGSLAVTLGFIRAPFQG